MQRAIGRTPPVELKRISKETSGRILAILNHLNLGFPMKDRVALEMIEDIEAAGLFRPGQAPAELTGGYTGTGLAIVCPVEAPTSDLLVP